MAGYIEEFHNNFGYTLKFDWPDGTVLVPHKTHYFYDFEVYLPTPDCYYRGFGYTLAEAELCAWDKFQKFNSCKGHEFERREYTNGVGFCKHCNLFKSKAFPPAFNCKICGIATNYCKDDDLNYYCEEHSHDNKGKEYQKHLQMLKELEEEPELTEEDFSEVLDDVIERMRKRPPSILNLND